MRTLCIGDQEEPTFTREILISDGWDEYATLPNQEVIFLKGDLIGFWNEQSGRFVTCKSEGRYFDYFHIFHYKAERELWWESIRDHEELSM